MPFCFSHGIRALVRNSRCAESGTNHHAIFQVDCVTLSQVGILRKLIPPRGLRKHRQENPRKSPADTTYCAGWTPSHLLGTWDLSRPSSKTDLFPCVVQDFRVISSIVFYFSRWNLSPTLVTVLVAFLHFPYTGNQSASTPFPTCFKLFGSL